MTVPNPPTLDNAPTPAPTRQDPVNFRSRADAYHSWLVPFVNEQINPLVNWMKDRTEQVLGEAVASDTNAQAAATAATAAAASQTAAGLSAQAAAVADASAQLAASTATSQAALASAAKTAAEVAAANAQAVVTGGTASITAEPGKIPLADAQGMLHPSWAAALRTDAPINDIGTPGAAGFGVGICPTPPSGISALMGTHDRLSANYGNYINTDGSVVVWIPAFYMRLAHADNPTFGVYGVNSIDIKPLAAFPDEGAANASGYYLHRAFVNAGENQLGFFRDKYDCSLTNGNTASSIALGMPLVSGPGAGQLGFAACTANGQTPTNTYGGAVLAARSRGAKWVPETIFMADALTRLSEAHAQAATSATHCAWFSTGLTNFPKGNNNSALRDTNDTTVQFTTAGAGVNASFALAGSGVPFSKTTHNGQACGVADVNGNVHKINPGLTCIATTKTITAATQTNPVRLTIAAHQYTTGTVAMTSAVTGMTQIATRIFTITVVDADTISLDGTDGTAFGAFTAGTLTTGKFYALKPTANVETMTAGNTLSTDYWGANGVAVNYDEITLNFATAYPNNGTPQRFGNAGNAVFDWATNDGRARSMLGMPAAGGISTAGSALMGNDRFEQFFRNDLCVISRGTWNAGSNAGVRNRFLDSARAAANPAVGFAASRYL